MEKRSRRRFLQSSGLAAVVGSSGCLRLISGDDGTATGTRLRDSDGDGVIDSEDYAPRDPDVQREEQVKGDETTTESREQEETKEETAEGEDETTDGIVAEDLLISRWPLQSDLRDTAGDNDASAERGTPAFGSFDGRRAVSLDGDVGVMIERGENPELSIMARDGGAVSVGAWVYFDEGTGNRDANGSEARHHILRNDDEYNFQALPTQNENTVELSFSTDGYATRKNTDDEMWVSTDEWHHFMYVIEPASSLSFYVDGEKRFRDDAMNGSAPTQTAYWSHETIGSWYGTNDPTWYDLMRGKIADLRIYDTGLSEQEVAQVHVNTR